MKPEPRNQHGGRPWTADSMTAAWRFYQFARKRDSATTAEIAEVMGTGVQVQLVVRRVAPWATYAVNGKAQRGNRGVWTWRQGCSGGN